MPRSTDHHSLQNSPFMQAAFVQAELASKNNEVPVGAVLVDSRNNKIIAQAHNQVKKHLNPTAHAEILLLDKAAKILKTSHFDFYDIYVTLEPCAMCAGALSLARIRRLYFAAPEHKFGAIISNINYFESSACQHKIEYYYGFAEQRSKKLLKDFFVKKR